MNVKAPRLTCDQEIAWLREGIEQALEHLKNDSKTLAIDVLKATLTHETW